ncbi:MAG: RluA family pseudouridine synthase [Gammaproteobacteria bacterium]
MKKTEVKQVVIDSDRSGQRIDNFLQRELDGIPRSRIYQMLRKGEVRVNKGRIKQTYRLQAGDTVRIPPLFMEDAKSGPVVSTKLAQMLLGAILYEDDSIIVLNKPSGLSVHGGTGQKLGLIEAIRALEPRYEKLELVHRLDRETSGCLLLAKDLPSLRQLHTDMKSGEIDKTYTALLMGQLQRQSLRVDKPLSRTTKRAGERIVGIDAQGKKAVTVFNRKKTFKKATLVEVDLLTGRTHQIRVHSASIGHPVIADEKYGDKDTNQHFRQLGLRRLFLHASALRFRSPASGKKLNIKAPLDPQLLSILDGLE